METLEPHRPRHLSASDELAYFDCGNPSLNQWLANRARANEASGASRTYVSCVDHRVVGYYALSTGAVSTAEARGSIRRNMPEPIPVILLGRLAVDKSQQGRGVGAALLRDAIERTHDAAEIIGVKALLVHAIDEAAVSFYKRFDFIPSSLNPFTLLQRIK